MNDEEYMAIALKLAEGTTGQTSPNPVVGAIVVKENQIVGIGAHLKAGTPHAEVHAIQMAGSNSKGGTLYVTLEPCDHFGKTSPCSEIVINSGITKVFVATMDPNPKVAGKGIEKIRGAGIEVEVGLLEQEAKEQNKFYIHNISKKYPYITLKSATSLDGKIATTTGESKWISGELAREDVHKLRHEHDAILVGINTILKDDPSLTTRLRNGGKSPIRIILDTHLRIPKDARVISDQEAPTWVITGTDIDEKKKQLLEHAGIKILNIKKTKIEIKELLEILWEADIRSLLVEGGAAVNASFLNAQLFQQVIVYLAPKLIGGKVAPTSFAGEGIEKINDAIPLKIKSVQKIGDDLKVIAIPDLHLSCKFCKTCRNVNGCSISSTSKFAMNTTHYW
ncbi:riboflavin biosynthesis protein RibD [Lysinibacillus alkalisoli]|uniref:Riboflavin biosynthesis protein RibD n=1 Tax=Lysinibacillus alkalisoli TaxID=1911548 RepID=A0A917GAX9_9BACI|nr:riboflavin biosynthesis protein RibD [Lysinibacillus alkalisoli]